MFPNQDSVPAEVAAVGGQGGALVTAKRGTAVTVGAISSKERFLYVIGGDTNANNTIAASNEVAFLLFSHFLTTFSHHVLFAF